MEQKIEAVFLPKYRCSICDSVYDETAGGMQGHFGMTPVTFCEWCYSSVVDMVEQMNEPEPEPEPKLEPCGMSRTWQHR